MDSVSRDAGGSGTRPRVSALLHFADPRPARIPTGCSRVKGQPFRLMCGIDGGFGLFDVGWTRVKMLLTERARDYVLHFGLIEWLGQNVEAAEIQNLRP